jgi:hypothetical protein
MEGVLYEYPMKKYIKDGKVLAHLGCQLKVFPGPYPAVGLKCRNPPRHLSQLKTRAIPSI